MSAGADPSGSVDAVVVVAMTEECAPFLALAREVGPEEIVGHARQRVLDLDGVRVLLVQCGIGMVNSAAAAAVALQRVRPRVVVSAGSAGGLGVGVHVGDVVVGRTCVNAGADARAFGYELGQVPGMPATYPGDEAVVAAAVATGTADQRVLAGTVLSNDAFVHAGLVDGLRTAFPEALATDMESAALAQTCHQYAVPFVTVRGISDLCGPAADDDFLTHVDDAADRSAAVVAAALRAVVAA